MALALVLFLAIPVLLVIIGVLTVIPGIRVLRSAESATSSAILRVVQGSGTALLALVPLSALWNEMQYGIIALPILGLVLAVIWNLVMGTAAWLARGA